MLWSCLGNPLSAFGCLTVAEFWWFFFNFFMIFVTWSVGFQMVLLFNMSLNFVCHICNIHKLREKLAKMKALDLLLKCGDNLSQSNCLILGQFWSSTHSNWVAEFIFHIALTETTPVPNQEFFGRQEKPETQLSSPGWVLKGGNFWIFS